MFPYLPELLVRHLLPCDPIVMDYTIKVDKEHHYSTTAYDIDVELENPIRDRIKMITQRHGILQRELSVLDEQISAIVQSIHESKSKRDFMKSFSDSHYYVERNANSKILFTNISFQVMRYIHAA